VKSTFNFGNKTVDLAMPSDRSGSQGQLLRLWDKSNRTARNRILEQLIRSCSAMTAEQLEHELDNTASLVLARVSSWLRLTYALGQPMTLQLRAVGIFISATAGRRFLAEFVEVGGVATVVEILSLPQLGDGDKAEAIQLLTSISEAGRHYKEVICDAGGIASVADFLRLPHPEEQLVGLLRNTQSGCYPPSHLLPHPKEQPCRWSFLATPPPSPPIPPLSIRHASSHPPPILSLDTAPSCSSRWGWATLP